MADSYGDVTGEYLALRTGAGVVTGEHELVQVQGGDAVEFLDGLLTQDLSDLRPGSAVRSLLLGPQGKLRAPLWVAAAGDGLALITDAGAGETVVADLTRFKLRVEVDISPPRPVVEVWGPQGADVLAAVGDAARQAVPMPLHRLPRFAVDGVGAETLVAAGGQRCGTLAVTTVRIEGGEPKMGVDVDQKTIPQESGLTAAAVSFTKGCYLGQELVARIDSRGHVNRHLRGVAVAENLLPPVGAGLWAGGRMVGELSSVGESLELRAPVALAMVRREVEPGAFVEVRWQGGSAKAEVRRLPMDDFA